MNKGRFLAILAFIITLIGLFIFFSNISRHAFNYKYTLWVWPWMLLAGIPLLVLGLVLSIISIIIYKKNNEKPVLAIITLAIIVLFAIATQTVTPVVMNQRVSIGLPIEIYSGVEASKDNPFVIEESMNLSAKRNYSYFDISIFIVNDSVRVYLSKCLDKNGKDKTADFNLSDVIDLNLIGVPSVPNIKPLHGFPKIRLYNNTTYSVGDTVTCWINASFSTESYSKPIQVNIVG